MMMRRFVGLILISLCLLLYVQRFDRALGVNALRVVRFIDPYVYTGKSGWAIGDFEDIEVAMWEREEVGDKGYVLNYGGYYSMWIALSGLRCVFTRGAVFNHESDREIVEILRRVENGEYVFIKRLRELGIKYVFVGKRYEYVPVNPFLKLLLNNDGSQLYEILNESDTKYENTTLVCGVKCIEDSIRSGSFELLGGAFKDIKVDRYNQFIVRSSGERGAPRWELVNLNKKVLISEGGSLYLDFKLMGKKKCSSIVFGLSEGKFGLVAHGNKKKLVEKTISMARRGLYKISIQKTSDLEDLSDIRLQNIGERDASIWGFMILNR